MDDTTFSVKQQADLFIPTDGRHNIHCKTASRPVYPDRWTTQHSLLNLASVTWTVCLDPSALPMTEPLPYIVGLQGPPVFVHEWTFAVHRVFRSPWSWCGYCWAHCAWRRLKKSKINSQKHTMFPDFGFSIIQCDNGIEPSPDFSFSIIQCDKSPGTNF